MIVNGRALARSMFSRILPHSLLSRAPQLRATKVMQELVSRSKSADGEVAFVNIGACDGLSFDDITPTIRNMRYLKALLVEPIPYNIERLRRNFPDTGKFIIEECAIAGDMSSIDMTTFQPEALADGKLPIEFMGASSAVQSNIMGGQSSWGVPDPNFKKFEPYLTTISVRAMSLQAVLDKHGFTRIDVMVVDTEGADWTVLRQLDLERYRPRLIKIEIGCLTPEEIGSAIIAMKRRNYDVELSADDLWAFVD
jgi:FkbM family methyltransferase